jgi:hypothetical protein
LEIDSLSKNSEHKMVLSPGKEYKFQVGSKVNLRAVCKNFHSNQMIKECKSKVKNILDTKVHSSSAQKGS